MGYPQSNMPGKIPEDGGNLICDKCEIYIYRYRYINGVFSSKPCLITGGYRLTKNLSNDCQILQKPKR